MRPSALGAGFTLALLLALPAFADDKNPPAKVDPKAPVDADKLTPGEFTGKLKSTPGSDGNFTLTVEYQHLELKNPNQLPKNNAGSKTLSHDIQHVTKLQQQVANAKKPQDQVRRLQELQNAVAQLQLQVVKMELNPQQLYKVVTDKKDVDFHASEDVKVRLLNLQMEYDDKGNLKKYTKEELKELKGKDVDLPGYEAAMDKLATGQKLTVTLAKHKEPAKTDKDKESNLDKDKDKDTDKDKTADKKTEVTLILIVSEDTTTSDKAKPSKK